jgi:hypothetical protein
VVGGRPEGEDSLKIFSFWIESSEPHGVIAGPLTEVYELTTQHPFSVYMLRMMSQSIIYLRLHNEERGAFVRNCD